MIVVSLGGIYFENLPLLAINQKCPHFQQQTKADKGRTQFGRSFLIWISCQWCFHRLHNCNKICYFDIFS